jgi:hypothetical protein
VTRTRRRKIKTIKHLADGWKIRKIEKNIRLCLPGPCLGKSTWITNIQNEPYGMKLG